MYIFRDLHIYIKSRKLKRSILIFADDIIIYDIGNYNSVYKLSYLFQ